MQAGKLNRRVRIEAMDPSATDDYGAPVETWTPIATVRCNVAQKSGVAVVSGGASDSAVQASIRIRYRTDVHDGMVAILTKTVNGQPVDGQHWAIDAVIPDVHGRDYVDLVCTALGNKNLGRG